MNDTTAPTFINIKMPLNFIEDGEAIRLDKVILRFLKKDWIDIQDNIHFSDKRYLEKHEKALVEWMREYAEKEAQK